MLIRPVFEPEDIGSFEAREASIEAGYQAAKMLIPELQKLLNR